MIFSTDICPICKQNLQLEVIEGAKANTAALMYYCPKKEVVRNDANTFAISKFHYENRILEGSQLVFMIIPPFELMHSSFRKLTSVRQVSAHKPKKIIFEAPLLDVDYSDTQAVTARLKLLVTFS